MTGDRDHVTGATGAWVDPQPRKPSTTSRYSFKIKMGEWANKHEYMGDILNYLAA